MADKLATTPPQPQQVTPPPQGTVISLVLPPGVEVTPIAEIDGWIRQGYLTREGLELIMKGKHEGKAYRKEIQQRLALYEARQPPFDNVPASGIVVTTTPPITSGGVSGVSPNLPTNSVLPPPVTIPSAASNPPSSSTPQSNPPTATNLPAELAAARNMSDVDVINSLNLTIRSDMNNALRVYKT